MASINLFGHCDDHPDCTEWIYRSGSKVCKQCWLEVANHPKRLGAPSEEEWLKALSVLGRAMRGRMWM